MAPWHLPFDHSLSDEFHIETWAMVLDGLGGVKDDARSTEFGFFSSTFPLFLLPSCLHSRHLPVELPEVGAACADSTSILVLTSASADPDKPRSVQRLRFGST